MDALQLALYSVGTVGVLPITGVLIANSLEMRRRRRAARIMRQFAARLGL